MAQVKFYLDFRNGQTKNLPIILKYSFHGQRLTYYTVLRADTQFYIDKYYKSKSAKPFNSKAPTIQLRNYEGEYLCDDQGNPINYTLNDRLDVLKSHLEILEQKAKNAGITLTPDYFRNELDNFWKAKPITEAKSITFLQFFERYIEYFFSLII